MPTYTCITTQGLLNDDQKSSIAAAVTKAHAQVTGAPAYFAQVVFQQVTGGDCFIGARPLSHDHIFVEGRIRSGRKAADRDLLVKRLVRDVAAVAGVETFSVWVYLIELPPAAMVEFGHILPAPGEEKAWVESLSFEERERLQAVADSS